MLRKPLHFSSTRIKVVDPEAKKAADKLVAMVAKMPPLTPEKGEKAQ